MHKSEEWILEPQTPASVPGDLATIPGVHTARLAAPDRPAAEPSASLALAMRVASECVLLTLISQG